MKLQLLGVFCFFSVLGMNSFATTPKLSSLEVFKGDHLQSHFIMTSWDQRKIHESFFYMHGKMVMHIKKKFHPETHLLLVKEIRGLKDELMSSEDLIYNENNLLSGVYTKDAQGTTLEKIAIDYDKDLRPVKVQRLKDYELAETKIDWNRRHALTRFYKDELYTGHLTYHFSKQDKELTKVEHFKSLFKICPFVELEPGIHQVYYKINSKGYKYKAEETLSKCEQDGEKLVCKGHYFRNDKNADFDSFKKFSSEFVKNQKPDDLTYGPLYTGLEKKWLVVSSTIKTTSRKEKDLQASTSFILNDKGLVTSRKTEIEFEQGNQAEVAEVLFQYKENGQVEKIFQTGPKEKKSTVVFHYK